jgi:hypothetical protein
MRSSCGQPSRLPPCSPHNRVWKHQRRMSAEPVNVSGPMTPETADISPGPGLFQHRIRHAARIQHNPWPDPPRLGHARTVPSHRDQGNGGLQGSYRRTCRRAARRGLPSFHQRNGTGCVRHAHGERARSRPRLWSTIFGNVRALVSRAGARLVPAGVRSQEGNDSLSRRVVRGRIVGLGEWARMS